MDKWTVAVSLGIALLSFLLYQRFIAVDNGEVPTVPRLKGVPNPIQAALAEGYQTIIKPLDKPFYIIHWTKKLLILPSKYLNDVRRADREHLQFQPAVSGMFFQYRWLEDSIKTEPNQTIVMKGVNPQLPKMSVPMIEEAKFALHLNVGEKSGMDSTVATLQALILLDGKVMSVVELANDLSLRTFTRVLGDKELCRDQKYIDAFNTWSRGNMMTGFITLMFPFESLRLTVTWPLAWYQKHVRQQNLFKIAKSHVIRRLGEERLGGRDKAEVDTLKSAIKLMATDISDPESINSLAAQLWQLTWAGAQSPTMTLANMFVRVLEHPEHRKALYEEARSAVENYGWGDAMLNHMSLMDSFIREVHRLYPILSMNTQRKVMNQPFTFSDGFTLPKGTVFAFPAASLSLDSELVEKPGEFDPYRFVKLAKQDNERDGSECGWAASQAGATNMAFGFGNHVCPGRFLAVRGLKIIFAVFLVHYEISWKRTDDKGREMVMEGLSFPDPNQQITIKRRL